MHVGAEVDCLIYLSTCSDGYSISDSGRIILATMILMTVLQKCIKGESSFILLMYFFFGGGASVLASYQKCKIV